MGKLQPMEGNQAVAEAMRQIEPDVVAAYPITPSTEAVQIFAKQVADGLVDTNFVAVESEHSAMSACIAASLAGGRVMTVTASQGLAMMWEMLFISSSLRAPVILSVANRALSGNINIHCDHSDAMGARDAGWVQLWGENVQEAYDNLIQAVVIGEREDVRLPVMNNFDGFLVSHSYELLYVEDDGMVKDFVGPYKQVKPFLDVDNPYTVGPLDLWDFYHEHKRNQWEAYGPAKQAVIEVGQAFGERFGRHYGLLEPYYLDDAELVIVALGSTAGTVKDVIEQRRERGEKVGLLKVRCFRPFPAEEIAEALSGARAVCVMDRAAGYGSGWGTVYPEVLAAMYLKRLQAPTVDYIYGLGGRMITPEEIHYLYDELWKIAAGGQPSDYTRWLGVRE
jgi:pyruvate ferredoxin oxidoreductase alpha subunit